MQKTTFLKFVCLFAIVLFFTKNSFAILTPMVDSITMSDGKKITPANIFLL